MEFLQAMERKIKRTSKTTLLVRQLKVTDVVTGPPPTVTVEDNSTIEGVRYLDSYTPTEGDTVWALIFEPDILVLGKLA